MIKKCLLKNLRSFSTRQRNFFELDPMFPDLKQDYAILNQQNGKLPYFEQSDNLQKIYDAKVQNITQTIQNRWNKRKEQEIIKKQQLLMQKKVKKITNKKNDKLKYVKHISQKILFDADLNLPYGFGFDDFMKRLKEENLHKDDEKYIDSLKKILIQLNLADESQLVYLYRESIAHHNQKSQSDRAKNLILQKIIEEFKTLRENKDPKQVFKDIANEFMDKSISDQKLDQIYKDLVNEQNNFQDIQQHLDKEKIQKLSEVLAKEEIDDKLQKYEELIQRSDRQKSLIQRNIKPDNIELQKFDDVYQEGFDSDDESAISNIMKNQKEQKVFDNSVDSIFTQLKQNYFFNKLKYINDFYANKDEKFDFLNEEDEDQMNLIYDLQRNNKYQPAAYDYQDIFKNINFMIQNAPLSVKQKIQENNSDEFEPNFINKDYQPQDLLWEEINQNFEQIMPINYKQPERELDIDEIQTQKILDYKPERYIYDHLEVTKDVEMKVNYDFQSLNNDQQFELEIYQKVKNQPFFMHHYQQNIKYYAERMEEGLYAIEDGKMAATDKFDIENIEDSEYITPYESMKEQNKNIIRKHDHTNDQKVFGAGKRKTSTALAIITLEGTGKVQVNKMSILKYFPCPMDRRHILKALDIANVDCDFDIQFFVHGGGTTGQTTACCLALTRALSKKFPNLREKYLKLKMLKTDGRKVERKKTGLYKARAKYPYVRR